MPRRTAGWASVCGVMLLSLAAGAARALPPVPVPPENPITEEKRVLGKILFWDEQLSSGGTMACATCHTPARGGTDGRIAVNPGNDGVIGSEDDTLGSVGVIRSESNGAFVRDALFALRRQVTAKSTPTMINAAYAPNLFWDGRAGGKFRDPISNNVVIAAGGALESQAAGPPTNAMEMAHAGVDWTIVSERLARSRPLDLAADMPPDVAAALAGEPGYPELFTRAFGDGEVTPTRIILAIATYQRTLISDDTPWDRFEAGDTEALTPNQRLGWIAFQSAACINCHQPPLFTDHTFRNIGVRPAAEDAGRAGVTGNPEDQGRVKTPGLRNTGLKRTFMHTGRIRSLDDVLHFYARTVDAPPMFEDNIDPLVTQVVILEDEFDPLRDLLENGFADARVANETFPFDHPTLYGESTLRLPEFLGIGATPGLGGVVPQFVLDSPAMIGNLDFRVGLDMVAGGAAAALWLSTAPPVDGRVTPMWQMGPVYAPGMGPGDGYATLFWPLANGVWEDGTVLYAQWAVDDASAEGGVATSEIIRLPLFCGRAGCLPACAYDYNRDGGVDLTDAQDLAQVFVGLESAQDGWMDGDVNGDENADLADAQAIARWVVGGACEI